MIAAFLAPLLDPPLVFGLPLGPVTMVLGVVGSIVGLLAIRRILNVEPEQRSFRATTRREPSEVLTLVAVVVAVVLGLVAFVATR